MSFSYKEWYAKNREKQNAYKRDYQAARPDQREKKRRTDCKRKYKLDDETYDKLMAQNECAICKSTEFLHIDHCHTTGSVRERLCRKCNLALGFLENIDWVVLAKAYMEKHAVRS